MDGRCPRTLVACSGGADSAALLLALASAEPEAIVAGHVIHDLRPAPQAVRSCDAAAAVAERVGVPFLKRSVAVSGRAGNDEANARAARYEALAALAGEHGCPFVATGHQADDQLETFLMAAVRGAGPRGLSGMPERRRLSSDVTLIRPMLRVSADEARGLCAAAGVAWDEDGTNADVSRTRAAVRMRVTPALKAVRDDAPARVARTMEIMAELAELIDDQVERADAAARARADDGCFSWRRDALARERPVVIGQMLRRAADKLTEGAGADGRSFDEVRKVAQAVRDDVRRPRLWKWAGGLELRLTADRLGLALLEEERGNNDGDG